MTTTALHRALLTPRTYPHSPTYVEFQETHISRLYLTDQYVYKLKKPLDLGFLDFTTLDQRHHYCNEELRLNSRYAPDTYLAVVTINCADGNYTINGAGKIVEYAVMMKRLPRERMLDYLIENDAPHLGVEMERLAEQLVHFHQAAPPVHPQPPVFCSTMRGNWRENITQTRPYLGTTLPASSIRYVRCWLANFYRRHRKLLRQREQSGFIRELHGDLHAEHICLTDPIQIYDCIEFNLRFRQIDIADELAFLIMDLEYRDRADLSNALLAAYQQKVTMELTAELLRFYRVYRAWVRGKVESFLSADRDVPDAVRNRASQRAQRYFNLALGDMCQPSLVLVSGLMGVGKSTLARSLARSSRALLLRSDQIRKGLVVDSHDANKAAFGAGIYSDSTNELTYQRMRELACTALAKGQSVIVDASFSRRAERDAFRDEARRHRLPCHVLHLHCRSKVALQRLASRHRAGTDISDGRPELYRQQREHFESISPAENPVEIETDDDNEKLVGQALSAILEGQYR